MNVQRYETNPQVIHETIEGETIIIDLATGTYFSLQGTAPEIWTGLVAGEGQEHLLARLQACYEGDAEEMKSRLASFLEQLTRDGLVMVAPAGETAVPAAAPEPAAERRPFEAPRLERYTDMQDIILLDPVHKVDNQGWPHPAPAATDAA